MLRQLENTLTLSRAGSPAKTFWRLGWIGFWTQIGFGSLLLFSLSTPSFLTAIPELARAPRIRLSSI